MVMLEFASLLSEWVWYDGLGWIGLDEEKVTHVHL